MSKEIGAKAVVGYVDLLGYLRCIHCADKTIVGLKEVLEGQRPHSLEACDSCGEALIDAEIVAN